jgi:hypothetical protein
VNLVLHELLDEALAEHRLQFLAAPVEETKSGSKLELNLVVRRCRHILHHAGALQAA